MPEQLTESERAQLEQTIEMFEVITQSQPDDFQSLEILKEAYVKLERTDEVKETAKKIARAYQLAGQLSMAILEWESILSQWPDDPDAIKALEEIESGMGAPDDSPSPGTSVIEPDTPEDTTAKPREGLDEGQEAMSRIFVSANIIQEGDFKDCWPTPDSYPPGQVVPPLIQIMADRGLLEIEEALKLVADSSKVGFLTLGKYDVDIDLARTFDRDVCKRWCVLPIDRMSKSILYATANPFNEQALADLKMGKKARLVPYLAPPDELVKAIGAVFH